MAAGKMGDDTVTSTHNIQLTSTRHVGHKTDSSRTNGLNRLVRCYKTLIRVTGFIKEAVRREREGGEEGEGVCSRC